MSTEDQVRVMAQQIADLKKQLNAAKKQSGESRIKRLRDEFAMAVLAGMVTAEYAGHVVPEIWATDAYKIADAALKAREVK